jgi:hypothetical protein
MWVTSVNVVRSEQGLNMILEGVKDTCTTVCMTAIIVYYTHLLAAIVIEVSGSITFEEGGGKFQSGFT